MRNSKMLNSFVYHEKLVPLQWFGMGLIVLPALFGGDWYRKELERGDRSHSTWDLKKLSTDPVASEKKPDGREHFYRVPTFQTFSFAAKGSAPSTARARTTKRREQKGVENGSMIPGCVVCLEVFEIPQLVAFCRVSYLQFP